VEGKGFAMFPSMIPTFQSFILAGSITRSITDRMFAVRGNEIGGMTILDRKEDRKKGRKEGRKKEKEHKQPQHNSNIFQFFPNALFRCIVARI